MYESHIQQMALERKVFSRHWDFLDRIVVVDYMMSPGKLSIQQRLERAPIVVFMSDY